MEMKWVFSLRKYVLLGFFLVIVVAVQAQTFTSTKDGNWSDGSTWVGGVAPGTNDHAVIAAGTTVKLTGATTIDDLTIEDGGIFDYDGFTLTLNGTVIPAFVSMASGNWSVATTWLGGSSGSPGNSNKVIICRDHEVKLTGDTEIATLIINKGGILNDDNKGKLTISSKLALDGERHGEKETFFDNAGATLELSGTGDHYSTKDIKLTKNTDLTILGGSDILVSKNISLEEGCYVTNNGRIIADDIKGKNGKTGDIWENASGSFLLSLKEIMKDGTLIANADGNTVSFAKQGDSDIKTPTPATFHNLILDGSLNKKLKADLTINGDLTISSDLDANGFDLDVKGDWTNSGTYTPGTKSVTFSGTEDQIVTNTGTEIYYEMIVNKASGALIFNDDAIVSNTLTMTGNINTGTNILTLGDTITSGNLTRTSGSISGSLERWIPAGVINSLLFPVGTATLYLPAEPTFSDAANNGGSVIISFVETAPGNSGLSFSDNGTAVYNTFVEGYWDFTAANGFIPGDFDLDLRATGMTSFTVEAATRLLKRTNDQSDWIAEGTHVDAVGNVVKRTTLTTLSAQYALADDDPACSRPVTYAITGDTEVCTDDAGDTYSVTLNSGNTYYWTVIGGTIDGSSSASGLNLSSVDVDWGSTGQVGNINVYEENACTRSDDVDLSVNINSLPPSTISGSTNVTENATGISYSVESTADYSYTWTIDGGTPNPPSTSNIITVDWDEAYSGSVSVVAKSNSCATGAAAVSLGVEVYKNILSVQTGNWNDPTTWDCNCTISKYHSVNIQDGHRVTLTGDAEIENFTVDAGGVVDRSDKKLKINANLTINGTITGGKDKKPIEIKGGAGTSIDGSGSINGVGTESLKIKGDVDIAATANLLVIGEVVIDKKKVVTNYGSITFKNSVIANEDKKNEEAVWVNEAGSLLSVRGSFFAVDGFLNASSTDNTVEYATTVAGAGDIKTPLNAKYYNLTISGTEDNATMDDLTILGDLTISSSTFDISTNANNLILEGNWVNMAAFDGDGQIVSFTGSTDQTITNVNGETFFDMVVNKSSGDLTLRNNVTVTNQLTMTKGDVDAGSNRITLGDAVDNEGTLTYTDGTIIGEFERWINKSTTAKLLFPIGTNDHYRPAWSTFSDHGSDKGGTIIASFIVANPGTLVPRPSNDGIDIYNTFVEGYWDFVAANGFDANSYDLELKGNGFNSFTIDAATRLLIRDDVSSDWGFEGTHVDAVDPIVKRTGLTTLSAQYAFGDDEDCTSPAAPTFTAVTDVCKGDNGVVYTISTPEASLTDYTWSVTGGSIAGGQNTDEITINWDNTAQVGSVGLAVTNVCTVSEETVIPINVHTIDPTAITGSIIVPEEGAGIPDEDYLVVNSMGYTYNWTVNGGVIVGASSGDDISVDWGVAGPGTISVTATHGVCAASNAYSVDVLKYVVINSIASGNWSDVNSWDCACIPSGTDNPIVATHTIILDQDASVNHFEILIDGSLEADNNRTLTVGGDMTIDGSISVTAVNKGLDIDISGGGTNLGGGGWINTGNGNASGTFQITGGNITIASTAVLTLANADFNIASGISTVTNNGSMTIESNLVATDAGFSWVNSANSTLKIEGTLLSATETLNASAYGNTVIYGVAGVQDIKIPLGNTYYNLTIGGSGTKTLQADTNVDGNLLITTDGVLDANNFSLNVAGNWTNESSIADAFLEGTGIVTFNGSTEQTITGTEIFYGLTLNNTYDGDAILLESPIFVTNSFTLTDGQIVSDATNTIDLSAGTAVVYTAGGGSFVDGPMIQRLASTTQTKLDFPVGKGDVMHLAELTLEQDALTETTYTAEYFDAAPPDLTIPGTVQNVLAQGHWTIDKGVGANVDAMVKLHYLASDGVAVPENLRVVKENGTDWMDLGGVGTAAPTGTITSTIFTSFSDFAFAEAPAVPLPVTLVGFYAELFEDQNVMVNWSTASELNNDFFTLEKSRNGRDFVKLDEIAGNGTTNLQNDYSFIDPSPYLGLSYYRLSQTDFDGTTEVFPVESVLFDGNKRFIVSPNPIADSWFNLRISGKANNELLELNIIDLQGRLVENKQLKTDYLGNIDAEIQLKRPLKQGVYIVELVSAQRKEYLKVVAE